MARPRKYTGEQQAHALSLAGEVSAREAGKRLGIPRGTIAAWWSKAGLADAANEKTRAATKAHQVQAERSRAQLQVRMLETAHDLLDRIYQPHVEFKSAGKELHEVTYDRPSAAGVQNYVTSVGILIDKIRLEAGESTSRAEHIVRDSFDEALEQLAAQIEAQPVGQAGPG